VVDHHDTHSWGHRPHLDTHRVLQIDDADKDADGLHPMHSRKPVLGVPDSQLPGASALPAS